MVIVSTTPILVDTLVVGAVMGYELTTALQYFPAVLPLYPPLEPLQVNATLELHIIQLIEGGKREVWNMR